MSLDGKGQKSYWEQVRNARSKRLQRLASGPVGAIHIRKGESEKQARKRILNAESLRLGLNPGQLKQSLDLGRKRNSSELKGKPPGESVDRRVT